MGLKPRRNPFEGDQYDPAPKGRVAKADHSSIAALARLAPKGSRV